MCYSAQIRASYKRYVREWGADMSIKQFARLYWRRIKLRGSGELRENFPSNTGQTSLRSF